MATQDWFATDWIQPNWNSANWYASPSGTLQMQLVGVQQDNITGASRWLPTDWYAQQWWSDAWFPIPSGWRAALGSAIQQFTTTFTIPIINVIPAWIFRTQTGFAATLAGSQDPNTASIKSQFTTLNNRSAQLAGTQANNTASLRASFTNSGTLRTSKLVGIQQSNVMTMRATHSVTPPPGTKRYGRIKDKL